MNNSDLSSEVLAELLTLTMQVSGWGTTYYRNHLGQFHRILGPAVIWDNGRRDWYQHGLLHRTNGPAVIYPNGTQYWYLNGQQLPPSVHHERLNALSSSTN